MVHKSQDRQAESDEEDFGLIFYNTLANSKLCQKAVKFEEEQDIIPDVGQ